MLCALPKIILFNVSSDLVSVTRLEYYPHFTDKLTETQKDKIVCPRSLRSEVEQLAVLKESLLHSPE